MAQTQQEVDALIDALIIDNNTQQINPAKVRAVTKAINARIQTGDASSVEAVYPLVFDPFTNTFYIDQVNANFHPIKLMFTGSNTFTLPNGVRALDVRPNGTSSDINWTQPTGSNQLTYLGTLETGDFLIVVGQYRNLPVGEIPYLEMVTNAGSSSPVNIQTPYAVDPEDLTPLAQVEGLIANGSNRFVKIITDTDPYFLIQSDDNKFLTITTEFDPVLSLGFTANTEFWIKNTSPTPREVTFDTDIEFIGSPLIPKNGLAILKLIEIIAGVEYWSVNHLLASGTPSGGGSVTSVNGQTGVVVLTADDIDDTSTLNKFATQAQLNAIALNTAKVTNATHTGDVTGSVALTIQPTAISGKTSKTTLADTEELLINDAGTLKKTTAQSIANLAQSSVKKQITDGYEYFNDFEGSISTTTNDTHVSFAILNAGTLTSDNNINSGLRLNTGTNIAGRATMFTGQSGNVGSNFKMIVLTYLSQLATVTDRFYFAVGQSNSATNYTSIGMFFVYDRYNDLGYGFSNDNWICVVRNGGSITSFDSGIAVSTSNTALQKLEIEVKNLAEVKFFINNNQVGTTITTNIATQQLLRVSGIAKTLGTTSVFASLDYLYLNNQLITQRI